MSDARGILLARRAGQATLLTLFLTIVSTISSLSTRAAEREFGGFGPEGPRMREQLWILPSGEAGRDMRATVFRPDADPSGTESAGPWSSSITAPMSRHVSPFRCRSITGCHAGLLSAAMSSFFRNVADMAQRADAFGIDRDMRASRPLCFGKGGGRRHSCSGDYMTRQLFVSPDGAIVVGMSTGGWASLALASRNLPQVQAIVNFQGAGADTRTERRTPSAGPRIAGGGA